MTESPFLTIDEAAAILRCHPATVREMVRNGKMPATKLGRTYRVHRDDLMPKRPAAAPAPTSAD